MQLPVDILETILLEDVGALNPRARRNRLMDLRLVSTAFNEAVLLMSGSTLCISSLKELVAYHRALGEHLVKGKGVRLLYLGFGGAATDSQEEGNPRPSHAPVTWLWQMNDRAGAILAEMLAVLKNLEILKMEILLKSSPLNDRDRLPLMQLRKFKSLHTVGDVHLVPHPLSQWPLVYPSRGILDIAELAPRIRRFICEPPDAAPSSRLARLPPLGSQSYALQRFAARIIDSSMAGWTSPLCKWLGSQNMEHVKLGADFSAYFLVAALKDSLATLRTLRLALSECRGSLESHQSALAYLLRNTPRLELLELDILPYTAVVLAQQGIREEVARGQFQRLLDCCPRHGVRITVLNVDRSCSARPHDVISRILRATTSMMTQVTGARVPLQVIRSPADSAS